MKINLLDSEEYKNFYQSSKALQFFESHYELRKEDPLPLFVEKNLYSRMVSENEGDSLIKKMRNHGLTKEDIISRLVTAIRSHATEISIPEITKKEKFLMLAKTRFGLSVIITFLLYAFAHVFSVFFARSFEAILTVYSAFFALIAMSIVLPSVYFCLGLFFKMEIKR
jgi:hypothetical protein